MTDSKPSTKMPRGMGRVFRRGAVWWIQYSYRGRKFRESSESEKRPDAVERLKKRQSELRVNRVLRDNEKLTLKDLHAYVIGKYRLKGQRSLTRVAQAWAHVEEFFGGEEALVVAIEAPRLVAYATARLDGGAALATIGYELAILKSAMKLAHKSKALPQDLPAFPTIEPDNVREGFFEREEHEQVRAALPADAGDLAEFLFWTGWRSGEAKGLRWSNVDEKAGVIRLEKKTKSKKQRTLPYGVLPALAKLLEHRRKLKDAVQKKRGIVVAHVFNRDGDQIKYFRRSWITACIAAGLGHEVREPDTLDAKGKVVRRGRLVEKVAHRIPHDYRRSAARNLSRAGVPEKVIMEICGWKTRSVFDRYRIVSERDLAEGLGKLAAAEPAAPRGRRPKVASIAAGRASRRGSQRG